MAFVLFFHLLALFLTLASGKPILLSRLDPTSPQAGSPTPFDVTLESLGNTTVQAQVTNVGSDVLRLVHRGGILDLLPTRKVIVNGTGSEPDPAFIGVNVGFVNSHLSSDAFVEVSPSQTVVTTFDVYELYDLTPGEQYSVVAKGDLEYTTLEDQKKFLHAGYKSNTILVDTPTNPANRLQERSTLESCTGEYHQIVVDAIDRAADMAKAAAADARTGSDLFKKFFMSTNQADMDEVADRLEAIAQEATTTGKLKYYCQPTALDYCGGNIAAITYPYNDKVVNCPGYYETPATTNYCGYLDQAAISLHEFSHANAIYNPGTDDVVYGYDGVLSLDTDQAKNNADSFAYYASAVYLNCAADDSVVIGTPTTDTSDDSSDTTTPTTTTTENPTIAATPTEDTPDTTGGTNPGGEWPWSQETPGTGTDGWGGGWGFPTPEATAIPVPTSGTGEWNMRDILDWLISRLKERYGQGKGQGQGQGAEVQATEEPPCDD